MSILGDILGDIPIVGNVAKILSPILGGASTAADKSGLSEEQLALQRAKQAQDQYQANTVTNPAARLKTGLKASMVKNFQPSAATFTPGQGLRGQPVQFTGGFTNPNIYSDPTFKTQADDVANQAMQEQLLRGSDAPPIPGASGGVGRDILGGAALGSSILGGLSSLVKPRVPSVAPLTPGTNETGDPETDWQNAVD